MARPTRRVRTAVVLFKLAVISVMGVLAIGIGTGGATVPSAATDTAAQAPGEARIAQLMAAHDCSTSGFAPGVIPGSAIVQRHRRVLLVSFDDGWATYTGAKPGTLVAVCRDTL